MSTDAARVAKYEVAADAVIRWIRTGRVKPGDKLPTHKELAQQLGVSVGTMQKALGELEDRGWVTSRPTVGVFVNGVPDGYREPVTVELLAQEVADLRTRVAHLEGLLVEDGADEIDEAVDRGARERERPVDS
ncbi:winged helix-turn-helix domain-containing protein [Amycolatopsis sp. NPDC051903]|uniref:winged helix-turn-helix domain-containing protein n=1 Tax=Amycolatopsis sp. NPDC051903 TaxID=3363936 RepID=UPI003798CA73